MSKIEAKKGRSSPMVMHKHEKGRDFRARMKWLVGFLNIDINSLNPIECLKLNLDFTFFIAGGPPSPISESILEQMSNLIDLNKDRDRKFLNTGQDLLREILEKILTTAKQIGPDDTSAARKFDRYGIYYDVWVTEDSVIKNPPLFLDNDNESEGMMRLYENRGLVVDALVEVLSRFPLSRIKTCQKPDCGNYFFQKTTKSKGDFCSPKCQNWARSNRWRKANPDKYNEYHRNHRAKAKEPWIKINCLDCRHEYSKGHPDPGVCSKCGGNLQYTVMFFEEGEWRSSQFRRHSEAEELKKEIFEYEKGEQR